MYGQQFELSNVVKIVKLVSGVLITMLCLTQPCYAHAKHKTTTKKTHVVKLASKTNSSLAKHKKSLHAKLSKNNRKSRSAIHARKKRSYNAATSGDIATLVNDNNDIQSNLPSYLLNNNEQRLVSVIYNAISTLRYSTYKLGGTEIDSSRGVYVVDCSSYVDHILKKLYPHAYSSLVNWSGSEKPTSDDYFHYFANLNDGRQHFWNAVEDVPALRPGDVLVFRTTNTAGDERGGHVMIVMDKPTGQSNTFMVRVSDSAPSGHSKDTRRPHTSGIGIGTLLLKVNPTTLQPFAYAWKVGSQWKHNVSIAMARPLNMG